MTFPVASSPPQNTRTRPVIGRDTGDVVRVPADLALPQHNGDSTHVTIHVQAKRTDTLPTSDPLYSDGDGNFGKVDDRNPTSILAQCSDGLLACGGVLAGVTGVLGVVAAVYGYLNDEPELQKNGYIAMGAGFGSLFTAWVGHHCAKQLCA